MRKKNIKHFPLRIIIAPPNWPLRNYFLSLVILIMYSVHCTRFIITVCSQFVSHLPSYPHNSAHSICEEHVWAYIRIKHLLNFLICVTMWNFTLHFIRFSIFHMFVCHSLLCRLQLRVCRYCVEIVITCSVFTVQVWIFFYSFFSLSVDRPMTRHHNRAFHMSVATLVGSEKCFLLKFNVKNRNKQAYAYISCRRCCHSTHWNYQFSCRLELIQVSTR